MSPSCNGCVTSVTGMAAAWAATMVHPIQRLLSARLVALGSLTVLVALSLSGSGCGGGGGSTGAGGSGGGGSGNIGGSSSNGAPCTDASRVGTFTVELVEDLITTSIGGGVRTAVHPGNVWQQIATAGDCRLIVGPSLVCSTACTNPQICAGQNQCIDEPRFRGVGDVTLTGLGSSPVAVTYAPLNSTYYVSLAAPYPPAAAGAAVTLTAAGGDLPGFTLAGRGISVLQFDTPPAVMRGQAAAITWVAPAQPGSRVLASLDIAHHGGVAARVECDFADDGSAEIPATMIDQLIDRGTAGFPELTLTRRTVDSTTIAPGCVEFQIASVIPREVTLCLSAGNCIISCVENSECPTGQICRTDYKCGT